jgi:anti-sigma regulatory factor (Ser/Thr protein kinase)
MITSATGPVAGDPAPGGRFRHRALFYRDEDGYLAALVHFALKGLSLGEAVAVAVPATRLDPVRTAVGDRASDVFWSDMTETGRNPGRIIPALLFDFADRHPDRPVRIVCEQNWPGRSAEEYPACAQHEALVNQAFVGRAFTMLCPYDARALAPTVLADAAATHPELVDSSPSVALNGDAPAVNDRYAPATVLAGYNLPLSEPEDAEVLRVDTSGLTTARELAAVHARRLGLADDRVEDVALVVSELVSNGIEHGDGTSTLRIWRSGDELVCQARGAGQLTDPLAGRRPIDPFEPHGRGLLLANLLADLVRIHTTELNTVVRAYFRK